MSAIIFTADDFGLAVPVNEAVERAHADGILSAASLMVTAKAADDAVERAKRLPCLGVGLHVVLVDGYPASPPERISALVRADGRFLDDPVRTGLRVFFLPEARRQAEIELRAQLEAFRRTGLPLDHVNGHHHLHQHPTIVSLLIKLAPEYGIRAVPLPVEPAIASSLAQRRGYFRRFAAALAAVPRFTGMRRRLSRAGIRYNDQILGLNDSGRMDTATIRGFLGHLPRRGVTEIYCHPATRRWAGPDALPDEYHCVEEFEALIDPASRAGLAGKLPVRFADIEG